MLQQEYRNNKYAKYVTSSCCLALRLTTSSSWRTTTNTILMWQLYLKHMTTYSLWGRRETLVEEGIARDIKIRDQEGVILKCCNIMVATIAIPIAVAMKKEKAMQVSQGISVNVFSGMDLSSTSLINATMRNISLTCIRSERNVKLIGSLCPHACRCQDWRAPPWAT